MKFRLSVLVALLLCVQQALAVEVTLVLVGETAYLKGEFQNGNGFEYRVVGYGADGSDRQGHLFFRDKGINSLKSTQTFDFMPGLPDETRTYEIYETEEAVFFRNSKNAFYLTSEGRFESVFSHPEQLQLERANFVRTASGLAKDYAIFSAPYNSQELAADKGGSGETYAVRLSDGAKVLIAREFFQFDVKDANALSESSFSLRGTGFNVGEVFAKVGKPQTAIVTTKPASKAKASANISSVREHIFENKNKYVTELRDGSIDTGSVFFERADGSRKRVAKGKLYTFPGKTESEAGQKLFQIHTDNEVLVVNDQGEVTKLEANYKQVERHALGFEGTETFVEHAGRQYLVVSFTYNGTPGEGPGETFIVREDGTSLKADFRSYNFKPDYSNFKVTDGILQLRGCDRLIDLNAFEAEASFEPKFTKEASKSIEEVEKMFRDLTFDMASGKKAFDTMDEKAMREMRIALQKQEARSVVVLGESGTGKTELVRSFIQDMINGKFPELPRTWRVFQFDPVTLSSGTEHVGTIEKRLENVIRAANTIPLYLFIDEIHAMRGIGTHSGNSNDVFQYLKTALANGDLMVIGTSTTEEYNEAFKGDSALDRRINKVVKGEPKGEEINKSIVAWAKKHKKRPPSKQLLDYTIRVAGEFNAEGAQPSKTIQLMEEVYAEMKLDGRGNQEPTRADIDAAAQKIYQADVAQFDLKEMAKRLQTLETFVNERVAGHDQVKAEVFSLIRQKYAGTHDPTKPGVSYVFAGPRGSGKTSLAFAIAEALGLPARRFEMNTYREGDGPKVMREVVEALRKNAFTVLVFDEIEKAPTDVAQALLGLLDKGKVSATDKINTTSSGGSRSATVSALNAMVFATTNAGADLMMMPQKSAMGFGSRGDAEGAEAPSKRAMTSESTKELLIRAGMSSPLIDRFIGAGWMDAASADAYRDVIRMQVRLALKLVSERLETKVTLANEAKFIEFLMKRYRAGVSNRRVLEHIQDTIRATLAEARLSGTLEGATSVVLRLEGEVLRVATCEEILGG